MQVLEVSEVSYFQSSEVREVKIELLQGSEASCERQLCVVDVPEPKVQPLQALEFTQASWDGSDCGPVRSMLVSLQCKVRERGQRAEAYGQGPCKVLGFQAV